MRVMCHDWFNFGLYFLKLTHQLVAGGLLTLHGLNRTKALHGVQCLSFLPCKVASQLLLRKSGLKNKPEMYPVCCAESVNAPLLFKCCMNGNIQSQTEWLIT